MADSEYLQSLLNDEDESGEAEKAPENKTISEMRAHIDRLEKAVKKAAKENEELTEFKVTVQKAETENKVKSMFGEIWGDPTEGEKAARLYFRGINTPDQVTEESLTEFVTEFGPARSEGVAETPTGEEPGPYSQLSAKVQPTPQGEAPVQGVISSEEMAQMMLSGDKESVAKAIESGRFKKNVAPWNTNKA
jgi:hypothetical protein